MECVKAAGLGRDKSERTTWQGLPNRFIALHLSYAEERMELEGVYRISSLKGKVTSV